MQIQKYIVNKKIIQNYAQMKYKWPITAIKPSREANKVPQCKSSYKKQAGSDKNLSVKPYSLIGCCFKGNL